MFINVSKNVRSLYILLSTIYNNLFLQQFKQRTKRPHLLTSLIILIVMSPQDFGFCRGEGEGVIFQSAWKERVLERNFNFLISAWEEVWFLKFYRISGHFINETSKFCPTIVGNYATENLKLLTRLCINFFHELFKISWKCSKECLLTKQQLKEKEPFFLWNDKWS